MMKCKHLNGVLTEVLCATHERIIEDGKLDTYGTNNIGNLIHFNHECFDCGKKTIVTFSLKAPKWLAKLIDGLNK